MPRNVASPNSATALVNVLKTLTGSQDLRGAKTRARSSHRAQELSAVPTVRSRKRRRVGADSMLL